MSHTAFVLLSYGSAALIFAVLLGWVLMDRAATLKMLAQLEAQGLRRRSDREESASE